MTKLNMTYREWLAGKALAGIMAAEWGQDMSYEDMAQACIKAVDTLIVALEKVERQARTPIKRGLYL